MDSTVTVVESQADWLTAAVHSREKVGLWKSHVDRWLRRELDDGARVRPFRLNGYVGYQAGRVRWGEREAAGLIQLSGDLAREHFDTLYATRDSLTRLDLAVTIRTAHHTSMLGQEAYGQASDFHLLHPHSALPSCVQDADGGWTTYVGQRASDYYLRIYDKAAECDARHDEAGAEHYRNCWRFELEVKGVMAPLVSKGYADAQDRPAWTSDYLAEWAQAHGIGHYWQPTDLGHLIPGFRRRSDRATRLDWLHRTVRPTVEWLLSTGDRTDVLERLGLLDLPNSGQPD